MRESIQQNKTVKRFININKVLNFKLKVLMMKF